VAPLLAALADLYTRLGRVTAHVGTLGSELKRLEALQVAGRVETARLANAADFRVLFEEVRAQIAAGKEDLRGFAILKAVLRQAPPTHAGDAVGRSLIRIQEWAATVAVAA
jgi:hypothetical protein